MNWSAETHLENRKPCRLWHNRIMTLLLNLNETEESITSINLDQMCTHLSTNSNVISLIRQGNTSLKLLKITTQ